MVRCGWEKTGRRVRAWVISDPSIAVEARTFAEADERLWDEIARRTGDGENYREYDPSPPLDEALRAFLEPSLVKVHANDVVHVRDDGLFEDPRCALCGVPKGRRTDRPLPLRDLSKSGGVVAIKHGTVTTFRPVFAAEFLSLLDDDERARFTWREVERPAKSRMRVTELVASNLNVERVGVKGLRPLKSSPAWSCERCGFRVHPRYVDWSWPSSWIAAEDLPSPLPSCFTVGEWPDLSLCFTAQRWGELSKKSVSKGLLTADVGVVPAGRAGR